MSFGMGFVFVPLTLTAVHGVRAEDSGIGSGVLNTMQQVGGALGLATLSTVATHDSTARQEIAPASAMVSTRPTTAWARLAGVFRVDSVPGLVRQVAGLGAFPKAPPPRSSSGTFMMLAGSAVVWRSSTSSTRSSPPTGRRACTSAENGDDAGPPAV